MKLRVRTYLSNVFRRFLGSFKPSFDSFSGGHINIRIWPSEKKSKLGLKEPKNRLKLITGIGSQSFLLSAIVLMLPFQKKVAKWTPALPPGMHPPPFFYKKIFLYPSDLLMLLFAVVCLYQYRARLLSSTPAKALLLFLGIALISILHSQFPTYLLPYTRLLQVSLFFLFFLSLRQAFQNTALFHSFAWATVVLALFQSSMAIIQFITQNSLGLSILQEHDIHLFQFPLPFNITLPFLSEGATALCRAAGTFSHPNILGGFLFFSLFITQALFLSETKFRPLLFCSILIQQVALLLSFSRAALFAYLLALATFSLLHFIADTPSPIRKRLRTLLLSIGASFILCFGLLYPYMAHRGGVVNYNTLVRNSDQERLVYQEMAWKMFQKAPWLGVGFHNFQIYSPHHTVQQNPVLHSKVHNVYLLILSETGLLGLSAFLFFLYTLCKCKLRSLDLRATTALSLFIGMLFIGGCDFYLWDSAVGRFLFFTPLALRIF